MNCLLFRGEQVLKEENSIDAQPFSVHDSEGKISEQERVEEAKALLRG